MPQNVEIKARVSDLANIETSASSIATEGPKDLVQDDTFFACVRGRLKLRELSSTQGQLIFYLRPNEPGPKISEYWIIDTTSPATLREALTRALGVVGRVRKHRRLYIAGRTRIHLDTVEGLGGFVELEVVLAAGESTRLGMDTARMVMSILGIADSQLVTGAYVDLHK